MAIAGGVALAIAPLLPFLYFGLQTRLIADDYVNIGLPLKIGVWETLLFWRGIWNGGYSNFLVWGLLAPLGVAAAAAVVLTTIAALVFAYSWLANAALARLGWRDGRRALAVCLASLMAAATINGFFSPHTLYWATSGLVYAFPVAMFLLGMALAGETASRLDGRAWHGLAAAGSALFAFINGGFSELYLVFQLACLAMMAGYLYFFYAGSRRRSYLILALSAGMGSVASLWLQVSAPGFALRSAATAQGSFLELPLPEMFKRAVQALETSMVYAGSETVFAGFMLVAVAALFLTLSPCGGGGEASTSRRIPPIGAAVAFALIVQLLFAPILWSHQSDGPRILGRFSYGFFLAVGINLGAVVVLLALLWRPRLLTDRLQQGDSLMKLCGGVLLMVCLLFALTQARSVHYRAACYLFLSAQSLLLALGGWLAALADEPGLRRFFWLSAGVAAAALLTLAMLVFLEMALAGFVNRRSIASVVFALMLAGMLNGVALGGLIGRGSHLTGARTLWLWRLKRGCLLVAFIIGAGIALGQARRVPHVEAHAALWDAQHQEIMRLRDDGDPAIFTRQFARIIPGKMDRQPPEYGQQRLLWYEKLFYRLDYDDAFS